MSTCVLHECFLSSSYINAFNFAFIFFIFLLNFTAATNFYLKPYIFQMLNISQVDMEYAPCPKIGNKYFQQDILFFFFFLNRPKMFVPCFAFPFIFSIPGFHFVQVHIHHFLLISKRLLKVAEKKYQIFFRISF